MCGIAGAMFWTDTAEARRADVIARTMTRALAHRGPDGEGSVEAAAAGSRVALGHRRLAIIDLSDRGAQPMRSTTAPVWITFNGEIYNFVDLRRELEALGRAFQSASDTEVILQGYEVWGRGVVDRLHGMFAFGLYDGRTGELLLARDRLGIKPLYVARGATWVLFASEVRALLASGLVRRRLRPGAIDEYLAYQTVGAPRTLIDGIEFLAPGHRLTISATGATRRECYWDFLESCPPLSSDVTDDDARDEVHTRLRRSVREHLIGDVPVGLFLSGGIDSTALVALARETGIRPRTFSVVMPGTTHDEGRYSREVATRFECEHTEVPLSEAELAEAVPNALGSFDHPTGDGINTFVVSRAVARAGLKVALSGLGGDEIFGGYPSFERLRRLHAYSRVWRRSPAIMRTAAAAAVRSVGGVSASSAKMAAVLESDGSVPRAYPILRQVFGRRDRAALLGTIPAGDPSADRLAAVAARHPDRDVMTFISYAESSTYMHDVLLRDSDQMSMASGLELRVPLLDHALVEYVVGLPEGRKAPRRLPKRLLVESVGPSMPLDIVSRPKRGFVLPFDRWMRGDLREFCEHHLGPSGGLRRAGVRPEAVDALWRSFLDTDRTTWSRPWTLVALGAWLEAQAVSA